MWLPKGAAKGQKLLLTGGVVRVRRLLLGPPVVPSSRGGVSPCTPSSFEALMMGVYCGVVWRFLPCVFATVSVCVCHSEVGFCVWLWVDLLGVVCAWRV